MKMPTSESPYAWFDLLIDAANAMYRGIIDLENLQGAEVKTGKLGGNTYAPLTTLTWRAEDGVSRNLHYAVVAPDDGPVLVPGSEAVIEANAWIDTTENRGVVVRRQFKYEVDRIKNLSEEQLDAQVTRLPIIFWKGYVTIKMVGRGKLDEKQQSPDRDPGPIGLERWLGE